MTDERRKSDYRLVFLLAFFCIAGYFAMLAALFTIAIPQDNRELVLTLAGLMSGVITAIVGYYFGASKQTESSQRKPDVDVANVENVTLTTKAQP